MQYSESPSTYNIYEQLATILHKNALEIDPMPPILQSWLCVQLLASDASVPYGLSEDFIKHDSKGMEYTSRGSQQNVFFFIGKNPSPLNEQIAAEV